MAAKKINVKLTLPAWQVVLRALDSEYDSIRKTAEKWLQGEARALASALNSIHRQVHGDCVHKSTHLGECLRCGMHVFPVAGLGGR